MTDIFDYLSWRGDILFSQLPPNPVDALIFSALSYIRFSGIVPDTPREWKTLKTAAAELLADGETADKIRTEKDLELLKAAVATERFANVCLSFYQDVFIPEEDTQFAAMTFWLEDGTAFLAFRGTDNTLVGWKEDFNMTFQESIPAQRLAQKYTQRFSENSTAALRLGGHSKGGNLAVYAAAKSCEKIQARIIEVYNQDGPGFTEKMLGDSGYLKIVPKIRTYVPQSSVFGMLLQRGEPHIIIRSKQVGLLQHDPYSWEVLGNRFILAEGFTADSRFLGRTFKNWLAGMTISERNEFFDAVFELLMIEDTNHLRDIMRPQNLLTYFRSLKSDEVMRKLIASELANLIQSAKNVQNEKDHA